MRHWKKKPWVDSEVRNWDYIADHLAPDATSADAGKVLTVGETGKPEWGEGGGSGGGFLVIEIDWPDEAENKVIINCSFSDIVQACEAHEPLYIYDIERFGDDNAPLSVSVAYWQEYETTGEITLITGRFTTEHVYTVLEYVIDSDGNVTRNVYN